MKYQTLGIRIQVKLEDIENLLYSAGLGSNYWADSEQLGYESTVKRIMNGESFWIKDNESDTLTIHELTLGKLKRGLTVMAKKYPTKFSDIMRDDTDAETADVLLQCSLFGEVIYG